MGLRTLGYNLVMMWWLWGCLNYVQSCTFLPTSPVCVQNNSTTPGVMKVPKGAGLIQVNSGLQLSGMQDLRKNYPLRFYVRSTAILSLDELELWFESVIHSSARLWRSNERKLPVQFYLDQKYMRIYRHQRNNPFIYHSINFINPS